METKKDALYPGYVVPVKAARQGGNTSEENGAGDLTDEPFADWLKHEMPAGTVIGDPAWWASRIERAAITSYLAQQQKPEQPTGDLRALFEAWFATVHEAPHHMLFRRLSDDRRYESMETEYAWQAYAHFARQPKAEQPIQAEPEGWMLAPKPRGRQSLAYLIQQASLACIENRVMEPDDRHEFAQYADLIRNSPVAPAGAQNAPIKLDDIEQYRLQMAAISTAALGYWTEAEGIKPEYDTPALRDVARLYAKYAALYQGAQNAEAIRNHALEEAAKVCDHLKWMMDAGGGEYQPGERLAQAARAIRALQSGTASTKEGGNHG